MGRFFYLVGKVGLYPDFNDLMSWVGLYLSCTKAEDEYKQIF